MTSKELERILEYQRKQDERRLRIIVESIEYQSRIVAELLLGPQEQLTAVRDMVAKNTEDI